MYNLEGARPSIQRIVNALSNALKVEVAVFDKDATLFHCTPQYIKKKGKAVHEPSIKEVLSLGSVMINTPGEMPSCAGCRFKDHCPSTLEILSCIKAEGVVIGVLAITSFTKEGKRRISSHTQVYLDAITELASLIGAFVLNEEGVTSSANINHLLHGLFEVSKDSLILSDANGVITQYNEAAIKSLNSCQMPTSSLWHILPENTVKQILKGTELKDKTVSLGNVIIKVNTKNIYKDKKIVAIAVRLNHETLTNNNDSDYLSRLVGTSPEALEIQRLIQRLADSPTPLLITGETGTGKELVARSIHEKSKRKDKPFVAINCSSIPENLFESELFGYEEGSFTGAKKGGKIGKIEIAQGGTLFLDELGEMPLTFQPKLLRVLQEYELERVGSSEKIPLNIRVIAATNRNLEQMMEEKKFREDLFYRIGVINIELPPLRQRKGDIIPIAENYLSRLKTIIDTPLASFDQEVKSIFQNYKWLGNIRELQNVIEYAANLCPYSVLTASDLPPKLTNTVKSKLTPKNNLVKEEQAQIRQLLDQYGYTLESKEQIAKTLGISLRTLYRKIEKLKIEN